MILAVVTSHNSVPIRLTEERWDHIIDRRPYMVSYYDEVLDTVEDPGFISVGTGGALIAISSLGKKRFLHVFYKEVSEFDGFIITAYLDDSYKRSKIIWRASDK